MQEDDMIHNFINKCS